MAKFIIEVSDEYIRDCADVNKINANLDNAVDRDDAIAMFADLLSFSRLEKYLDDGVSEFVLSQDNLPDDKILRRFFRSILRDCATIKIAQEEESSENKNKQSENVETKA